MATKGPQKAERVRKGGLPRGFWELCKLTLTKFFDLITSSMTNIMMEVVATTLFPVDCMIGTDCNAVAHANKVQTVVFTPLVLNMVVQKENQPRILLGLAQGVLRPISHEPGGDQLAYCTPTIY